MNGDSEKLEQLTRLAERLMAVLQADISALASGELHAMRTTEPDVQRLSALYAREAQGIKHELIENVPSALQARFTTTLRKFRELLQLHARLLTRVRNASEGMIRAIADEVERQAAPMRTYSRGPSPGARRAPAMVHNSVA